MDQVYPTGGTLPVPGASCPPPWWRDAGWRWAQLSDDERADWCVHHAKRSHPLHCEAADFDSAAVLESERAQWFVRTRDFGNGHREALVMRRVPQPFAALDRGLERGFGGQRTARGESDSREDHLERAVRRAKSRVRLLCKALGVNSLWTLTYRENVQDRALVLRHLDRFRRAVASVLPGWRYVAVLERQERGAWHIHLATHALARTINAAGVKLDSWAVMRGVWRGITRELGGNFDEAKRSTRWGAGRKRRFKGATGIANYIGGYVAKDMVDSPLNKKRFSSSSGVPVPRGVLHSFDAATSLASLIEWAYAQCGARVCSAWFDPSRALFSLATDDTGAS